MKQFQINLGTKLDDTLPGSFDRDSFFEHFAIGIAGAVNEQFEQLGENLQLDSTQIQDELDGVEEKIGIIVEAVAKPDFTLFNVTLLAFEWQQEIVDRFGKDISVRVDFTMSGMSVCYVIILVFIHPDDKHRRTADEPRPSFQYVIGDRRRWLRDAKANAGQG